jgi:MFS family permease
MCKFLYGFANLAIAPLLIPLGETYGIRTETLSLVFAFYALGQIIIVFFVGFFADKLGRKIFHIIFVIFFTISALALALINNYILFLTIFFLLGIFGISINLIADSSISDIYKINRGYYLNIAHIFYGLGAITAPVIYNILSKITTDFRIIYFALVALSILTIILIVPARYPLEHDLSIKPQVIISMLRKPKLLLINIFGLIAFGTLVSIPGWLPTLFQKSFGVGAAISNYSSSFFWIAAVVGRVLAALLSKKFKELPQIKAMNIIIFFLLAVSFFINDPVLLLIDYLLLGLFTGVSPPLIISYTATLYKKHSNTRLSITFSAAAAGMFLLPTLTGVIGEYISIQKVISFTAVFFFAYIFIFWKVFRDQDQ